MDMNFPTPLSPPEALRRLLEQVMAGEDAVVDGPGASVVLDQAAALLAARRSRVLRAAAAGPDGLGLQELMDQVAGRPDPRGPADASLEQGAQALTVPDAGCDRIVLLLDDAEAVQPAALRYVQLACRTGSKLRLVLAGLPDGLDGAEFAPLRARLQARPVLALDGSLPKAAPDRPAPQASAARPGQAAAARHLAALPSERPRAAALAAPRWARPAAAALGLAACVALAAPAMRRAPEPPETMAALPAAAQPAEPAPAAPEVSVALTAPPLAAEAQAATPPAGAPPAPSPAAAQPAPEPLPFARPPGRRGATSRQAEARPRALLPHGERHSPARLPRGAGQLPAPAAQPYDAWEEPWADASEDGSAPYGGPRRTWQRNARPWPPSPPDAYPGGTYAGSAYPGEPWRQVSPWWPR